MNRGGASARETALAVLLAWDASQETADTLLSAALDEDRLSAPDRRLAAELVRGVFRWRGRLDWQLSHLVQRPLADLDTPILWTLRLGLHQLENLDRIPVHAVVDTAVNLAKRHGSRGAGGLVNAVLRRASRELATLEVPDPAEDPLSHLEVRTSHPRWLLERWLERRGFGSTLALAAANNRKPALTLRGASDRVELSDVFAALRDAGVAAEPGHFLPGTIRLPDGWHSALRPLLTEGVVVVQDEAAGLVTHAMRPEPGATLLDVCAAPGGKALHFAALSPSSRVIAADRSRLRLQRLAESLQRSGGDNVHLLVADGCAPATRGGFSRVLVDAPCSNTGVLGRRPDARWRRSAEDLPRLQRLQGDLLDGAREQVGREGLLIYATCSLEPEENEDVIAAYLRRHPQDRCVPAAFGLPEELAQGDYLVVDPVAHELDGAFAAVLQPGAEGETEVA